CRLHRAGDLRVHLCSPRDGLRPVQRHPDHRARVLLPGGLRARRGQSVQRHAGTGSQLSMRQSPQQKTVLPTHALLPLSSMERGAGGEVMRSHRFAFPLLLLLSLVVFLTACAETGTPSGSGTPGAQPISDSPPTAVAIVRSIATVDLPPTLSRVDKLATRQAIPQTPTAAPPT